MIRVKFDDKTTKVYRNNDTVRLNQYNYIGAHDLRVGYTTGNKKIVDIERFNPIVNFVKCCGWLLVIYIAVVLVLV